ncbi:hypothetical protein ST12_06250 [Clostridium botulinum]|uniref:trypsin-like peptidase domain-containing protein n=1 Tax=Clostridium botulinum TaxID=1491 RepID=UPI000174EAF4|nr:trypsin-like peptidase domain-containing protein [Clostridium botulinum]ACD52867.1 hypothetical protein CLH_1297 [Clostridium botulinum E3 str. Alaska E43]AJF29304.1 hypothetical protein ST13_06250 [Clostridium botulinum]AJF32365.1 hypothetical protein ST12_06250 [Clostridium botulinum]MBY6789561.1 trypsin-like peptidase domain-containing protein [Clostridium botulinum]MBY6817244.1 trypsin-like peptidase domain-containing protein [Clostridium botulinum]
METRGMLDFIFKVNIYVNNVAQTVGTAFIIGSNYAITAKHVIEKCGKNKFILESYNLLTKVENCFEYCSLKVKEHYVDIAIIKFSDKIDFCTNFLPLISSRMELYSNYSTYGYPQINRYDKFFISGEVISPENKLSIINSSGEYKDISLYSGVSGAPLVIDNEIYGIISDEIYGTQVTLPQLMSSNFSDINSYIESLDDLDENTKRLQDFLKEYCKKEKIKSRKLDPYYNKYDAEYSKIKDKRNISEKILSVCESFPPKKLMSWQRRVVYARTELENLTTEQQKAIIMAVFFPCITYIDENIDTDLFTNEEISKCIDNLKTEAKKFIEDRKKDYDYGVNNTELIENIIFNLIDTCFLSFDSYLEE